jgi:hypothetical protein
VVEEGGSVADAERRRKQRAKAERALRRGVRWAHSSGTSLAVLGGLSALLNVMDPLTASFIVSVAVVANGVLERRFAAGLERREPAAAGRLAANQGALGMEVVVYSLWQARGITPDAVRAYLADPNLSVLLEMYPSDQVQALVDTLPALIQAFYALVAGVAVVGCALTALFYLSRRKHLAVLGALEAVES